MPRASSIKPLRLNLLDRYVLREWLKIFALALGATLGVILMQTLYQDLRDLMDRKASFADTLLFIGVRMPSFLALVVPIVLLVSLLYALGQLHRNNEIIAMRAAGLSVLRLTRSIWLSGVVLCGVMWWLNSEIVPRSVEASRALSDQLEFEYQAKRATQSDLIGVTRTLTFDNHRQGRMWLINRFSRANLHAYGVTVSELDAKRREKLRVEAREAKFDPVRNYWVFWNGRQTEFDTETGDIARTVPFSEFSRPNYTEDPELMLIFDIKPSNLSFFELRRIIDYFQTEENPKVTAYAVRYYGLISDTLAPLIIIAIAIPFAVSGIRVNPAVGVSKSLGLFLLYFIFLKLSTVLGTRKVLDPMLAAWVPNLAMIGVGAWVFFKRR